MVFHKGGLGETYNIGGRNERNNLYIVDKVCSILDEMKPKAAGSYKEQITFVKDRPGHDLRYALDGEKMKNMGWTPHSAFERLESTIKWTLNNDRWLSI